MLLALRLIEVAEPERLKFLETVVFLKIFNTLPSEAVLSVLIPALCVENCILSPCNVVGEEAGGEGVGVGVGVGLGVGETGAVTLKLKVVRVL